MSTPATLDLTELSPLIGITEQGAHQLMEQLGEKSFRAKQLMDWVYRKRVETIDEMTTFSLPLRAKLASTHHLQGLEVVKVQGAKDTTRKFLFKLSDRRYVESVLIPANVSAFGERSNRRTVCVSSQVGCAYGCKFCASGLAGFTRNLTTSEIVLQVMEIEKFTGERVDNLVFMGMGEPMANLKNLLPALEILNSEWGLGIGARHMTVSTSGLAPQIKKLAEHPLQVRLAISLHGATNEVRNRIMPVNHKYPLEALMESLREFRRLKKQKITFEYILIEGVNSSLDQAMILGRLARSIDAKVNLIPYNTVEGLEWKRPSESAQEAFLSVVKDSGVTVTLRREKGHDIDAACGQLRLKTMEEDGEFFRSEILESQKQAAL